MLRVFLLSYSATRCRLEMSCEVCVTGVMITENTACNISILNDTSHISIRWNNSFTVILVMFTA